MAVTILPGRATTGHLGLVKVSTGLAVAADGTLTASLSSSDIPNLDTAKITSGTLADARLSANVPLLNAANTFTAVQTATAFAPSGLTGSTSATRYVGGTASAAPTTGAHNLGDWVITQAGSIYICTTAGTPGTWTAVSGGSGFSNPMTTAGDIIIGGASGAATRLAATTNGYGLQLVSGSPAWVSTTGPGALMPAVRCYNSGNQSIPNTTYTAITLDTNRVDQGTSTPQHSTLSNTSRLTCQQAGMYTIGGCLNYAGSSGGNTRTVAIRLNGSTFIGEFDGYQNNGAGLEVTVNTVYQLAVGDYVELLAYQNSGGPLNVLAAANIAQEFWMARIDSGPGAVQPNTKVQLDYTLASDFSSSTVVNTWTDVISNQTFTVDDPNSIVEISVNGNLLGDNVGNSIITTRVVIDSSGTPNNKMLSGGRTAPSGTSDYANILAGAGIIPITGLSAGSHTVKLQYCASDSGGTVFCNASTTPNFYFLSMRVLERKITSSPASSVPAPAVRAYNSGGSGQSIPNTTVTTITLDTNDYDQGTSALQHSTSTNTSRLTCQQSGIYAIHGQIRYPANGTGIYRQARILVNGATQIAQDSLLPSSSSPSWVEVNTSYYLNIGDYVELQTYQDSGGALVLDQAAHFTPAFMMARTDSGPGAVQPNSKVQLAYVASTDLASATSISGSAWTNICSDQTFTVDDGASTVDLSVSGSLIVTALSGTNVANIRALIDGATAVPLETIFVYGSSAGSFPFFSIGQGPNQIGPLSAGSHTIRLQINPNTTTTMYLRASTQSLNEFLRLTVLERKQSSSPPSSTPAPAVRCYNSTAISISNGALTTLTFDTTRFDQGTSTVQHSTTSNTSRLTCQQAGAYQITGNVQWPQNTAGRRLLDVSLNGTTVIGRSETAPSSSNASNTLEQIVTCLYQLAVGDYVELRAYQDSSGSLSIAAVGNYSPEFMMARVDTGGTGAVYVPTVKTSNYTILATDSMVVAGANSLTLTLPAASAYTGKAPLTIKNDNFTSTTVARAGSDTIDGGTTYSLASAYASAQFVSDGNATWRVV